MRVGTEAWRSAVALATTACLGGALAIGWNGCDAGVNRATASRVGSRSELIGGPDALGEVGDFKLSNGKVQFIIQAPDARSSYSRGWGVYAGAVLDADLVRPASSPGAAPTGNDRFGEMFPAMFLEAVEPLDISIGNDGKDGQAATIIVQGRGSPFLTLARNLIDVAFKPDDSLAVTTTYSLSPDAQDLTITSSILDESKDRRFPTQGLKDLLGQDLGIPFGNVLLFGARNEVFLPGTGFDLRYGLEKALKGPTRLPALNGIVSDLVATRADGVSYGFITEKPENPDDNYVWRNRQTIGDDAIENGLLVPFYASSFTGAFTSQPPSLLKKGETFSWTSHLIVGHGDVGSVRDVQYGIINQPTGRFTALVLEEKTGAVVPDVSLIVYDAKDRPYSQYTPDKTGRVSGRLPPGEYRVVAIADNRQPSRDATLRIAVGRDAEPETPSRARTIEIPQTAKVSVRIFEERAGKPSRPMPAKVTFLSEYPDSPSRTGKEPRQFLFDLAAGERWRSSDLIPDSAAEGTRSYIERVMLAGADGIASGDLKPGTYAMFVSRGPEYDLARIPERGTVTVAGGTATSYSATLRHVVDTTGYVSADFHVHTSNSIDGHIALDERVLSYAAEGVEIVTATDHNIVTDLKPNVEKLGLTEWMGALTGLEMTTLEMGHFNAFPVQYDPGTVRHGAYEVEGSTRDPMDWVDLPPRELFQTLRAMGETGSDTVVQVNHPRDTILGYFNNFTVSPDTGLPRQGSFLASPNGPAFGVTQYSWAYDALEVFNGKRNELLRTYRMPANPPVGAPTLPISAGEIVREPCAETKPDCDYSKQEVAYPGHIEDWFNVLNMGGQTKNMGTTAETQETIEPITGTGNSDSHGLYVEEAGYPRNWIRVNTDDVRTVQPFEVARAVKRHRVVFSNGPFLDVFADGSNGNDKREAPIGGLLSPVTNKVTLDVKINAAPWIDVQRVIVYVNGQEYTRRTIPAGDGTSVKRCCEAPFTFNFTEDAWIVVAAEGDRSMFPIIVPLEQAPLTVTDAIAAIAGPLGFGANGLGPLKPSVVGHATPFAMTNPIWIDRSGGPNGSPDGKSFGRTRDPIVVKAGESPLVMDGTPIEIATPVPMPVVPPSKRMKRSSDILKLFQAWGGHSHVH